MLLKKNNFFLLIHIPYIKSLRGVRMAPKSFIPGKSGLDQLHYLAFCLNLHLASFWVQGVEYISAIRAEKNNQAEQSQDLDRPYFFILRQRVVRGRARMRALSPR